MHLRCAGRPKFANLTRDYAPGGAKNPNPQSRRQLGIVLDGTLYSSPSIREAIFGGSAQIEGNFSVKEARTWPSCCAPARCPPR
jgi:preprotein translocase subunit SecD